MTAQARKSRRKSGYSFSSIRDLSMTKILRSFFPSMAAPARKRARKAKAK